MAAGLGWLGIVRLGLVQTALGAIVVLTTSTMNRVMVIELALPAMLPGALVAWHYALQALRPRWGFGADAGRRLTPLIIIGMAILALGGALSAVAVALMAVAKLPGIVLAVLAFTLIGVGVGAAGTSLLVLLTKSVAAERRPAAATIVWLMMIAGFAITAGTAGHFLDPFSLSRLVTVTSIVSVIAFTLAVIAVHGVEAATIMPAPVAETAARPAFRAALLQVWSEPETRLFTIFLFISMLAYSAQDLILEPYAGTFFGLTPGQSTQLSGLQNGGVFSGMVLIALIGGRFGTPQLWTALGCVLSAIALTLLVVAGEVGPTWPVGPTVFGLGFANGLFAAAAIASMMTLAGMGRTRREGTRMGVWGAAQAIAFGIGGTLGAVSVDVTRALTGSPLHAYGAVFLAEAVLFVLAAMMALRIAARDTRTDRSAARPTDMIAKLSGRG
ncbi:MAG: BCD family MFS transporter [Labrys sp. (in: a-proteobacteria)]